jgi:hypothetical protein
MTADLSTTNLFLGVLAVSSVLEVLAAVAVCVGVLILCRRIVTLLAAIQKDQVAPAATRVHAILDDIKGVTSTVRTQASHVDAASRWAANLVQRFARSTSRSDPS